MAILTFDQLRTVLAQQNRMPQRRLGELLLEHRWIESEILQWGIQEQLELRLLSAHNAWHAIQSRLQQPFMASEGASERITQGHVLGSFPLPSIKEESFNSRRLTELEQQLRDKDLALQEQYQLNEQLTQDLAEKGQLILHLQFELDHPAQEEENVQLQLQTLQQEVLRLQTALQTQQQLYETLIQEQSAQAMPPEPDQEMQEQAFQQQIQQQQTEIEGQQSLLEQLQSANTRLVANLAQSRQENRSLQKQVQELEQINSTQAEQIRRLRSQLDRYQEKAEEYIHQVKERETVAHQKIHALQQSLKRQIAHREALKTRFDLVVSLNGTASQGQSRASTPSQSLQLLQQLNLDAQTVELLKRSETWVRRVVVHLCAAGLLTPRDAKKALTLWNQEGGQFTNVLSKCTQLKGETIQFFSEGGYKARLEGAKDVVDYLIAAGLVTYDEIQLAQQKVHPGMSICQKLIKQRSIEPQTAEYFKKTFNAVAN
ncbi:MAG: hypothetical protein HC921_10965 [Synechococcaceae cyanobacterium SM2_3_1]|nr:hypothetical protein [Synechococcaceae cyanobacterium SM2_3_1]